MPKRKTFSPGQVIVRAKFVRIAPEYKGLFVGPHRATVIEDQGSRVLVQDHEWCDDEPCRAIKPTCFDIDDAKRLYRASLEKFNGTWYNPPYTPAEIDELVGAL